MNDPNAIDGLLAGVPDVLTTEEVAELMRVERPTVLRWANEYGLKVLSIGTRVKRIRKEDLREFLLHSDELE